MRTYLYSEAGFIEKSQWMPNSWVNVECPDDNDFDFLTQELKVPESFLEDIADADERPRTETEGNWLLTILRIPMQSSQHGIPFITVPIGIITNNEIIVSVCYHKTELISDFIQHTRRKGIVVNNKLDLILRMIYSSAVWFLKYLKQINNDVANAEKELEKSIRNEDLLRLMKLQKTLVYFNTSIRGNEVMIGRLKNIFQDTDYLDMELLEDVVIELKHLQRHPDRNDGCFCLHYFQQRQCYHETHDEPFHHAHDTDTDSQFLRHECGYSPGRFPVCFHIHYPDLRNTIGRNIYLVQED